MRYRNEREAAPGRARSRLTVSARFVVAVLVPMLALTAFAARTIAEHRNDVRLAEQVSRDLDVVDQVIELRSALFAEHAAAEMLIPARRPPDEVLERSVFGRSLLDGTAVLEARTDAALAALPETERPFSQAELDAVRAERASWSATFEGIRSHLGPFLDGAQAQLTRSTQEIRNAAAELGDRDMIAAETMLQRSIPLPVAAGEVLASVTDLWVADPEDRLALQSLVAANEARFVEMSTRFGTGLVSTDDAVGQFWSGPVQIPEAMRTLLDAVARGELTDPERASAEPVETGIALLVGIDWIMSTDRLPAVTARDLDETASAAASEARRSERTALILIIAVVVVSIATAVLFGRSIVTPVRRLTNQARRVGNGELDLEPLAADGPADVALAAEAFNDVVSNLVLLEQKSRALADCDFEHPSLGEPLPGRLGASLQRSSAVLSTSIRDREQLRSRLVHDATHDALTGLANRAALLEELARLDHVRPHPSRRHAVLFVDIDGFRQMNDRYGNAAGDRILRVVAERIAHATPAGCTVGRLSGDEFVVVLSDVTDPRQPERLAMEIVNAVATTVTVGDHIVTVRASAGVAVSDLETDKATFDSVELLQRADLAVSVAKRNPAEPVASYDAEFGRRMAIVADIESSLADALQPGVDELVLVFQPIVGARSGRVDGIEALIRWDRPGHGRVPPDAFVPIAERTALIVSMDLWVLRSAVAQLTRWESVPALRDVSLAVNVSGRSLLDPSFVDRMGEVLQGSAVEPRRLTVEVTETALVTDIDLAAAQLRRLRALGVRVAIDDFGTGYTSIAHLRAMPVDELKIDSSFVQRLPDQENRVFIQMINDLAHNLGVTTVAEGVETVEQIAELRAIGCDDLQGYYFSRPVSPDELQIWIEARNGQGSVLAPNETDGIF